MDKEDSTRVETKDIKSSKMGPKSELSRTKDEKLSISQLGDWRV